MMKPIAVVGLAVVAGSVTVSSAQTDGDWWREAVFYEVFVRSFADSTSGPLAGDGVGDLRGLIERLDVLNDGDVATDTDLGVTALWLMPIFESPSYHGYDIVDYRRVDAEYGTNDDFKVLIAACEARGMRVIVDLVLNHCSWEHPWFIDSIDPASPKRDWFIWAPSDPGWRGAWGQDAWHPTPRVIDGAPTLRGADDSGPQYYGLFYHGMPDLNFRNRAVSDAAFAISRFWIEDMGAHGFRLDAIRHLIEDGEEQESTPETIAWLEGYKAYLKTLDAGVFTVGEIWADTEDVKRYIPDAIDSAFEFDLAGAIVGALETNPGDSARMQRIAHAQGVANLRSKIEHVRESYPANTISTFLTNHDQDRVMSRLGGPTWEGFRKAKAAATLLLTLPGVPFLYYGEEIGMSGRKPDPDIRTPMQWEADVVTGGFTTGRPWRAVNDDVAMVNLASQRGDRDSLWTHYRDLIALRRATPALSRGTVEVLETGSATVLGYRRVEGASDVLVLANIGGDEAGTYAVSLGGFEPGVRVKPVRVVGRGAALPARADDAGVLSWRPVRLGPYETAVIDLTR